MSQTQEQGKGVGGWVKQALPHQNHTRQLAEAAVAPQQRMQNNNIQNQHAATWLLKHHQVRRVALPQFALVHKVALVTGSKIPQVHSTIPPGLAWSNG